MHQILTIDDNPADANVLKRLLRATAPDEFEMHHFATAQEGLWYLKNHPCDCIIVDYLLGAEDGIETIQKIRASGNDSAILAYTGAGSETIAVQALQAGAQDYLVKGEVTGPALYRALQGAIERAALNRKVREQREEQAAFVGMVAHDLRAPLRHMTRFAEILAEATDKLEPDEIQCVEHIHNAGTRMSALLEALLEYTRSGRSSISLEPVALNDVLNVVLSDLSEAIRHANAEVCVTDLPVVQGEPIALSQLFQNLIGNAIKYNRSERPQVHVFAEASAGGWRVSVQDNGIGIPANAVADVFEPLQRLHRQGEYEGTGLGLATARKIAEQHGARIDITSEEGAGSTFTVTFPGEAQRH